MSAIGSTAINSAAYSSGIGTVSGIVESANWKNSSGTFPKRTSSAIRGTSRDKLPGIAAHQKLHSFNMRCENLIFSQIGRVDRQSLSNVYHVAEFCGEIHKNMLKSEKKWSADANYMSHQVKIDETIRSTLVDWLI